MSDYNTAGVPEVSAYAGGEGVTAYAVRLPGERRWTGHACRDGSCVATQGRYGAPDVAAARARWLLERSRPVVLTGDYLEDELFPVSAG